MGLSIYFKFSKFKLAGYAKLFTCKFGENTIILF